MIGWLVIFVTLFTIASVGNARDNGQWENSDPKIRKWFQDLKQPDTLTMGGGGISCCGPSDAYYADVVKYKDGKMIAVITDERDDIPLQRFHEEPGTEYEVPPGKITSGQGGNPTGHVIIFLGRAPIMAGVTMQRPVLCYVLNGGV